MVADADLLLVADCSLPAKDDNLQTDVSSPGISRPVNDRAFEADEDELAFIGDPITSLASGPAELCGLDKDVGSRSIAGLELEAGLLSNKGGGYVVLREARFKFCRFGTECCEPAFAGVWEASAEEDVVDSSSDEKSYAVPAD